MQCRNFAVPLLVFALLPNVRAAAAADAEDHTVKLAGGKLQMSAAENWQKKKPQNNIIEYEFSVPKAEGDENDGRVTMIGAGGTVDANIERWTGQFEEPGGAAAKPKINQEKIAGCDVHLIDISGTFKDKPPFSGTEVKRPGYRMFAAVIVSKDLGNYFVKFYGPQRTVTENEKAFSKMLESIERK